MVIWLLRDVDHSTVEHSRSILAKKPVGTFIILLPLLKTMFIFLVWVSVIIFELSVLGFDAGTVLAGLGIGGLAVAMASQKTFSDIIGGISILLSRSFKIGDVILHNNKPFTIENISLRYTRLREYLTDYLVTIPNSLIAEQELTNISEAYPGVYRTIELPLSIRNNSDKIKLAMRLIAEVIEQNPNAFFRWMRFDSFENYTFTIKSSFGVAWEQKDWVQTEIYIEIVRRFQENDIEFTHPV